MAELGMTLRVEDAAVEALAVLKSAGFEVVLLKGLAYRKQLESNSHAPDDFEALQTRDGDDAKLRRNGDMLLTAADTAIHYSCFLVSTDSKYSIALGSRD